jgi:transcriptional regulator with XRE-family HTH domain
MACTTLLQELGKEMGVELGRRIRTLRKLRRLSQREMFGLDRSFVSDMERGAKMPSLPVLKVLAVGFEVPLAQLVEGL